MDIRNVIARVVMEYLDFSGDGGMLDEVVHCALKDPDVEFDCDCNIFDIHLPDDWFVYLKLDRRWLHRAGEFRFVSDF